MHKKIWIVDDDRIYRLSAIAFIKLLFPEVEINEYENGKQALDALKNNQPDLILLDLNMPIIDGWDLLNEFDDLSLKRELKVCLVSSSLDLNDRERARSNPYVSDFKLKPLSENDLKEIISNSIEF